MGTLRAESPTPLLAQSTLCSWPSSVATLLSWDTWPKKKLAPERHHRTPSGIALLSFSPTFRAVLDLEFSFAQLQKNARFGTPLIRLVVGELATQRERTVRRKTPFRESP